MKRIFYLLTVFVLSVIILLVILFFKFFPLKTPQPAETYPSQPQEERFGIGGGLQGVTELGLTSARGWGHGRNSLERQAIRQGLQSYFVTGKFDNATYTSLNPNPYDTHPKCKKSVTDSTIVNCITVPLTGVPNDGSFAEIARIINENPLFSGQIWEISNEPDSWPFIVAEDYAVWFHMFEREIHRNDPTAKIMNGGFFLPSYLRVNNSNWVRTFRAYYKTTYGTYPPVDVWNIHPYYAVAGGGSAEFIATGAEAIVEVVKGNITAFRNLIDSFPEERGKPLYLTEFPFIVPLPCCGWIPQNQEYQEGLWRKSTAIAKGLTDWLKTTNYAQKWHWFAWQAGPLSWLGNTNTYGAMGLLKDHQENFFQDVAVPDLFSINYAKMAKSAKLFNPSFEAYPYGGKLENFSWGGLPAYGWGFWTGGSGSNYKATTDNTEYHSVSKSVKVHIGNETVQFGNVATISQEIPSSYYAGKYVKLSAWCKTANGGRAGLKISLLNASGGINSYWQPGVLSERECPLWTKIEKTTTEPIPADTIGILAEGIALGRNADVWFDDFNLELTTPPPPVCQYDYNENHSLDAGDIQYLLANWQGNTSIAILMQIIQNWGAICN